MYLSSIYLSDIKVKFTIKHQVSQQNHIYTTGNHHHIRFVAIVLFLLYLQTQYCSKSGVKYTCLSLSMK